MEGGLGKGECPRAAAAAAAAATVPVAAGEPSASLPDTQPLRAPGRRAPGSAGAQPERELLPTAGRAAGRPRSPPLRHPCLRTPGSWGTLRSPRKAAKWRAVSRVEGPEWVPAGWASVPQGRARATGRALRRPRGPAASFSVPSPTKARGVRAKHRGSLERGKAGRAVPVIPFLTRARRAATVWNASPNMVLL